MNETPAMTRDDESAGRPTLFLAGDCAPDARTLEDAVADGLGRRVESAGLAVSNLDGPLATREAPGDGRTSRPDGTPANAGAPTERRADRRLPRETPAALTEWGFDGATLANDRAMAAGPGGLRATLRSCHAAGLSTCGAGRSREAALDSLRATVDGAAIAVFGLCERRFDAARAETAGTAWVTHPDVRRRVSAVASGVDLVVASVHGGVEFAPLPPPVRRRYLRELVDAGADLVVGHHPGVPGGWEVYEGAPIFYSLGTFLAPSVDPPARGLCLEVSLEPDDSVSVDLVPTARVDGAVRAIDDRPAGEELLGTLRRATDVLDDGERYRAHWQALADRLFEERYRRLLRRETGWRPWDGRVSSTPADATHPGRSGRSRPEHALLDLLRPQSPRAVLETALALRAGETRDRRTPESRKTVGELLEWAQPGAPEDERSTDRPNLRRVAARLGSLLTVRAAVPLGPGDDENP